MLNSFCLDDYNFACPPELIAQKTAGKGKTKILICSRKSESFLSDSPCDFSLSDLEDSRHDLSDSSRDLKDSSRDLQILETPKIVDLFNENDCLVVNNTKVIPARLFGETPFGGKVEILLVKELSFEDSGTVWEVLGKPGKNLRKGKEFFVGDVKCICENNNVVRFPISKTDFNKFLAENGHIPLPPYINRKDEQSDKDDYQTVFAKYAGAVAAPTASLHFSDEMVLALKAKGVSFAEVTLHVGPGTFQNITETGDFRKHKMHSEFFEISSDAANAINKCKKKKGRVVCVGTTSMRVLETVAGEKGFVSAQKGSTNIFIYPSYKFKCADGLLTNFHWAKSSLILLVSAFYGREKTLNAYKFAIENEMKFFSYGDGMLIL
ncbi:S-adenosylmethionine:tRNA ribosyltransferase-isomerase [Fibrobacterales bacterium]|nr:S-adenosylmethionine:tRNA ribosyltransferase-isomerase [Fibrobacterales bacterium]